MVEERWPSRAAFFRLGKLCPDVVFFAIFAPDFSSLRRASFLNFSRMGFFSIFSKEKKQELDEGLQKSKESFFAKLAKTVVGKSKVDDDVLDRLEEVLVTSDVGVETTLRIISRIENRVSRDKYIGTELLRKCHITKVVDNVLLAESPLRKT